MYVCMYVCMCEANDVCSYVRDSRYRANASAFRVTTACLYCSIITTSHQVLTCKNAVALQHYTGS